MKTIVSIVMIPVLAVCIGCGGSGINNNAPKVYDDVTAMKNDIKAGVESIDIDSFKKLFDSDEMFILLDIREPNELEEGMIPGAICLPRGQLEFKIGDERFWDAEGMFAPEKDECIILYCDMIDRGAFAVATLSQLGYTNVKYIYGGYTAWIHGPEAIVEEEVIVQESGCGA